MGFLGSLFGSKEEHQPLDPGSTAAARIERSRASLEAFAHKTHDRLEVVPGERAVYVFIGRPPEAFGIVWFEKDGEEHNFKTMMKSRGLEQRQMAAIAEHLRLAYLKHREEPRFTTTLAGKKVTVTPSASFEQDIAEVIHEVD
jgi:hypothetical protein